MTQSTPTRKPLQHQLAAGEADPAALAARLARNPKLIEPVLASLDAPAARSRFGAAKVLLLLSELDPAALYSAFDFFVQMLDHPNRILRWQALRVLGNLARADDQRKIEAVLSRILEIAAGPELIGAANAMQAAAAIASAKPRLAGLIASALARPGSAGLPTDECRHIAAGHAIQALDRFFPFVEAKQPVLAFVSAQLSSPRRATRRKAERFLTRWRAS